MRLSHLHIPLCGPFLDGSTILPRFALNVFSRSNFGLSVDGGRGPVFVEGMFKDGLRPRRRGSRGGLVRPSLVIIAGDDAPEKDRWVGGERCVGVYCCGNEIAHESLE